MIELVPACGMRCGQRDEFRVDVDAQAADLFAVMDHHDVTAAHVVGLCGGAVIALAAAAVRPERVTSPSLWHGDHGFADLAHVVLYPYANAELLYRYRRLDARSRVAEHGDHISLFDADESVPATARAFMTDSMERV